MKYRVIVNGISFYTTATAIKRGVGDSVSVNTVVRQLFENMFNATGISTTMAIYDHKMNKETFNVQINKIV